MLPLRPSGTSPFFDRGGVFDSDCFCSRIKRILLITKLLNNSINDKIVNSQIVNCCYPSALRAPPLSSTGEEFLTRQGDTPDKLLNVFTNDKLLNDFTNDKLLNGAINCQIVNSQIVNVFYPSALRAPPLSSTGEEFLTRIVFVHELSEFY